MSEEDKIRKKVGEFYNFVNDENRISIGGKIILLHLAVEKHIDGYLEKANVFKFDMKKLRLPFSKKIDLSRNTFTSREEELLSVSIELGSMMYEKNCNDEIEDLKDNSHWYEVFNALKVLNEIRNDFAHRLELAEISQNLKERLQNTKVKLNSVKLEYDSYPQLLVLYEKVASACAGALSALSNSVNKDDLLLQDFRSRIKKTETLSDGRGDA